MQILFKINGLVGIHPINIQYHTPMVPLLSLVLCDAEMVDNSFRVNVLAYNNIYRKQIIHMYLSEIRNCFFLVSFISI